MAGPYISYPSAFRDYADLWTGVGSQQYFALGTYGTLVISKGTIELQQSFVGGDTRASELSFIDDLKKYSRFQVSFTSYCAQDGRATSDAGDYEVTLSLYDGSSGSQHVIGSADYNFNGTSLEEDGALVMSGLVSLKNIGGSIYYDFPHITQARSHDSSSVTVNATGSVNVSSWNNVRLRFVTSENSEAAGIQGTMFFSPIVSDYFINSNKQF